MNWLERARREILEGGERPTANSAERSLTAVMAVPPTAIHAKSEMSVEAEANSNLKLLDPARSALTDLGPELPRYRWLIVEPDGRRREVCCLPEMTATELSHCYPGARLVPLPDSAAATSVLLDQWDAA